jgi:hypothetical protein
VAATVGAGIAGISAARYLESEGFTPTVFESHSDLGGQWNFENPNSGIWPSMRTNTAGFCTKLSDVQYPQEVKIFPHHSEVLDMIRDMVVTTGIGSVLRFGAEVTRLAHDRAGYSLSWSDTDGAHTESFDRAVVASGRFLKPENSQIEGDQVTFEDGTVVQVDAIVIGTGFDLHLPFLSDEIRKTVDMTSKGMDLCHFTFHLDLPGLAFAGLWSRLGPYPVVLEQQARWISYSWSGTITAPTEGELRQGVADCVSEGHHAGYREQHKMAVRFAKLAGTMPVAQDKELAAILPKCPITGETFRVSGPDAHPDATEWIKRNLWRYAEIPLKREIGASLGLDENGRSVP